MGLPVCLDSLVIRWGASSCCLMPCWELGGVGMSMLNTCSHAISHYVIDRLLLADMP